MNGVKIYHSKFRNLETIILHHMLFPRHGHHDRYGSIQAKSIVQFLLKVLSLWRS